MPGDEDALMIRANARVAGATVAAGSSVEYRLGAGRKAYLVPARGTITVNGPTADMGDGVAVQDEDLLTITASEDAEIVLVDTV
jgi:redox-sensitive bicupin YhaK (pirin superfamily)